MQKAFTNRGLNDYLKLIGPGTFITIVGFIVAYQFVEPAPPRQITIAAGQSYGTYFKIGKQYSHILARNGVTLTVRETSGSVENLELISDKDSGVDIIFLQGGVGATAPSEDLVSLGSIYYEPLWVFHRSDLPVRHLGDLRGKRIAVGMEGSGTRELALRLLSLNDINAQNSHLINTKMEEAVAKLVAGEIDATFFVIAYRKDMSGELLWSPDIRLLNFRRGEAYTRRLRFLSLLKLPEGTMDFTANIPKQDVHLLAPTAQLVVRKDFHPALIDLILLAAQEVGSPAGVFEQWGEFPSPKYLDYPLSSQAERFYKSGPPFLRRYLPFWLANFLIRMKIMLVPLVALLFPLIKLLPPFYSWRMRSRIFRWYEHLMEIDYEILHGDIQKRKNEFMSRLNTIEQNASKISVPLGYSGELYNMRIHIEMLRGKLLAVGADVCQSNSVTEPEKLRQTTREKA